MRDLAALARRTIPTARCRTMQRGDMLRGKQRFTEAIAAYDRAIGAHHATRRRPTGCSIYDRGVAEERAHQWPKAEADFQRALQLSPDQPFVLNYLGYSWADRASIWMQARQMIENAAEHAAKRRRDRRQPGLGDVPPGRRRRGGADAGTAVELEPEDPTINEHLGDAYWAAGRKLEAPYQWRRALTLQSGTRKMRRSWRQSWRTRRSRRLGRQWCSSGLAPSS